MHVYNDRVHKSESKLYKKNQRIAFGAIQQFDLYGEYPNRRIKNCFIKRGTYYQLIPEFKEFIDFHMASDKLRGLKEQTIYGNSSAASTFLCAMQKKGLQSLDCINEEDVLSFFLDSEGKVSKCSSYKKQLAAVFKAGIGWKEKECQILLAYLPPIRPKRKNIQFLTSEEVESIHALLDDRNSGLSLRDRAVGKLLFFSRYIAAFLYDYAPGSLTNSERTLKSYKDALTLYVLFLESEGITPSDFTKACFEKLYIEKWIRWLKVSRNCCPDTS